MLNVGLILIETILLILLKQCHMNISELTSQESLDEEKQSKRIWC